MKTLFLDCFSGISGDMFIGAMLDLGVPLEHLKAELAKVHLHGYHLHAERGEKSQISGIKFDVHEDHAHDHKHQHSHAHHDHKHDHSDHSDHSHPHTDHHHHHDSPESDGETHHHHHEHRTFATIRRLIEESSLSGWVKTRSIQVFQRVAEAEGKIHGLPPEEVHFHEVGAIDSIVDIIGACIALDYLERPRVLSGPVVEGTGFIRCAHGRYPLPGPASLSILGARGIPITQCEEPNELVTPTGAALLAEFAESSGPMQDLVATKVGFGLGSRTNQTRPNVLRAILGESSTAPTPLDWESDSVSVLETNLDDLSPELLGHFIQKALSAGALDVFHTPIQMKKSRPGILLTVLAPPEQADTLSELILRETSAFGVRRSISERRKLRRSFTETTTPWGKVRIKQGLLNGEVIQSAPEYEDCRTVAEAAGIPLKQVFKAASSKTTPELPKA